MLQRSAEFFRHNPLVALALAFLLGLAFENAQETALALQIFPLALAFLSLFVRRLRAIALPLLYFFAGTVLAPEARPETPEGPCARALGSAGLPPPTKEEAVSLEIEGVVQGAPALRFRSVASTVEIVRARPARTSPSDPAPPWTPTLKLLAQLGSAKELRPLPGDALRAIVILDDVPAPTPAAERAELQRHRQGIACTGWIRSAAVIDEGAGLFPWIEVQRRRLAAHARLRLDSAEARGLVPALMVGDRSEIAPEQAEHFADSGLAHVLSVSGLHLSLTVLGLFRILRALLLRFFGARLDPNRWAAWLSLPFAPIYAALTGAQPPVLRAALGAGLFLLGQAIFRRVSGWNSLGLAALALLAWTPSLLHEASFQLSFAACAGLLAYSSGLRELIPVAPPGPTSPRWRRWLEAPLDAFAVTLGATLATLPLTALHFSRVSLSSLAANVVGVPVALLSTVLCACALGAGLVHETLSVPILWLAGPVTEWLDGVARFFAALPGARIPLASPSLFDAIVIWIGSFGLAWLRRRPLPALACMAAALLILGGPRLLAPPDERLVVEFLPIGQGDATLLRLPSGEHVLVDTGGHLRGEYDISHATILRQLTERGVRSLRVLAFSHLHPDHVGSAPTLLRSLPVGEVWTTGRPLEGRFGQPIAEAIAEREVPLRRLARGSPPIELGGVRFEILGPPRRYGLLDHPLYSANDASLVLRVVHGDVAILLPGDIEKEAEEELVASGIDLSAQLLKVPHHGSRTSSTPAFLSAVRPDWAVFPIGWRNPFGFPHAEVAARYEAFGIPTRRTDLGPVRFASDGRALIELFP